MNQAERERFDELLETVLEELPEAYQAIIEEVPVVVEDRPDPAILEAMEMDPEDDLGLCGLYTGVALTERSVGEGVPELPETIHLYRLAIIAAAEGWHEGGAAVREQIRITLLHEIGHHFGLSEEDLDELGYG